jgi:hypothetical protein
MTITLATGRTLNINFVHSSPDFETREGAGAMRQALDADARNMGRRLTLCEISQVGFSGSSDGNGNVVSEKSYATLAQGVGVCHPSDVFEKSTGRLVSTVAALRGAAESVNADETVEVLVGYFAQFPTEMSESFKQTLTKVLKSLNLSAGQRGQVWAVFYKN